LFGNLITTPAHHIFSEALQKLFVKESQMSDLSQQNTESTVMAENTGVSLNCGYGNKVRVRTANPAIQNVHSLPRVRKRKILEIRQQLIQGTYDIDKRLNTVLDRLLEDILV